MNKDEFMRQVEYLLSDIPEEETADAVAYYRDYLEEAGDTAGEVLREFGSPERIAAIIRSDLRGDLEDGGAFTERGYEDERFKDPGYQVVERKDLPETVSFDGAGAKGKDDAGGGKETGEKKNGISDWFLRIPKGFRYGLLAVVLLAAAPVLLGIGGGILGIVTGILGLFLALILSLGLLTFGLLASGFLLMVFGVAFTATTLPGGLACAGIGLILLSLGLLGVILSVWFYGKCLPWMVRSTVEFCSRLFHRRTANESRRSE